MGGCVFEGLSGNKDLITPEYREASCTGRGVDASLAYNGFEDSDWFGGAIYESVANRKFLWSKFLNKNSSDKS